MVLEWENCENFDAAGFEFALSVLKRDFYGFLFFCKNQMREFNKWLTILFAQKKNYGTCKGQKLTFLFSSLQKICILIS